MAREYPDISSFSLHKILDRSQNSEDAKSQVAEKFQVSGNVAEGKIEDSLLKCALQGADICPVQVISVVK